MKKQSITNSFEWKSLQAHFEIMSQGHIRDLFIDNPNRGAQFNLEAAGLYVDYSKNHFVNETLSLLIKLAEHCGVSKSIEALFSGACINYSEKIPALHTALRSLSPRPIFIEGTDVMSAVREVWQKIEKFVDNVRSGLQVGFSGKPIRHIVNVGVGGSHLGPLMAFHALKPYADKSLTYHFISNQDETDAIETLSGLNPECTLFIIASKSFTTKETIDNANRAKHWLLSAAPNEASIKNQLVAVTANREAAHQWGIDQSLIFPLWSWVGGRYSIWSAVGLSLAIAVGWSHFREFLSGAQAMDDHFRSAELSANLPVVLALLSIWYINFFKASARAVIPYTQRLLHLPNYLMQLYMESHGKSVCSDGTPVNYDTGAVVWGGIGTDSQHSFHQLFLQGTVMVPIDFILPLKHASSEKMQLSMIANCLAQSETLLLGYSKNQISEYLIKQNNNSRPMDDLVPHKIIGGNIPSNTILFDAVTPYHLGALLALYEHKVYVQSVIWNINAFDQWGVERGKKCAEEILLHLSEDRNSGMFDSSTEALLKKVADKKKKSVDLLS